MQVNLLKSVVSAVVGQHAIPIVDLLYGKKNVNEFLISKKLKMTINQTRNILYKLADEGIVSFLRKKDRKKGGWYIYFWTLNTGRGLARFKEHLVKDIENARTRLEARKKERFFYCPSCNLEANEEIALQHQYTCPECGEVLQLKERAKEVEALEKEIKKLEEALVDVNKELEDIMKKEEAVKARKMRAEARKKVKERALKKKKKERELKKLERLKKKLKKGKKKFKKGKKNKRRR